MSKRENFKAISNGIGWAVVRIDRKEKILSYEATGLTEAGAKTYAGQRNEAARSLDAAIRLARGGDPPTERKGHA